MCSNKEDTEKTQVIGQQGGEKKKKKNKEKSIFHFLRQNSIFFCFTKLN